MDDTAYYCGARKQLVKGHHPDECVPCLRANRDYWKGLAQSNHLEQVQVLSRRVRTQRVELARLNNTVEEWTKAYYAARALNGKLTARVTELVPAAEISDARQDTIDALNERCRALIAENVRLGGLVAAAVTVIQDVEWAAEQCPACLAPNYRGHDPDCIITEWLRRAGARS